MESNRLLPHNHGDEEGCEEGMHHTLDHDRTHARSRGIIHKGVRICRQMYQSSLQNASGQQYISKSNPSIWRFSCRKIFNVLFWAIILFILLSVLNGIFHPSYAVLPKSYGDLEHRISKTNIPGRGNFRQEKVFIAANIINEELIRGPWGAALLELIHLLGEDNVFVSIYENDSGHSTQNVLQELQRKLPCKSSVVTGGHLSLDSFPSVHLPDGQDRVQRLTYLAEVRNRLLRPLDPAFSVNRTHEAGFLSASTTRFDKILFLNDVYFSPLEALHLLFSTNMDSNGVAQYRTACAIDFVHGVMFYDSFIVRDTDGYGMGLMFYPWFAPAGSSTSRQDVRSGTDAVRVRSCWGGMAAFNAAVFQSISQMPQHHPTRLGDPIPALQNSSPSLPPTFRSSNEMFWESGECCLLFADIEQKHGPPIPEASTGVFVNPFIRVAYTSTTWRWLPFYRRIEHVFEYLQLIVSYVGYPEYNPRRTHEPGTMVEEMVWTTFDESDSFDSAGISTKAAGHFQLTQRVAQPGGFCGQRRLFVMKTDLEEANRGPTGKNWEKIQVPLRVR